MEHRNIARGTTFCSVLFVCLLSTTPACCLALQEQIETAQQHEVETASPASPSEGNVEAHFRLEAGKIFENSKRWDEAEKQYISLGAVPAASPSQKKLALEGLIRTQRARLHDSRAGLYGEELDSVGKWLLRIVVVIVGIAILLDFVLHLFGGTGVEIAPFSISDDGKLKAQIESSFLESRARLLVSNLPSGWVRRSIMFSLEPGPIADLSLEAAGFKFAGLASLWRYLIRPRFRITGGGYSGKVATTVHAEIWRRRWWFGQSLEEVVIHEITAPLRVERLEEFVYAVFLRIWYAPR